MRLETEEYAVYLRDEDEFCDGLRLPGESCCIYNGKAHERGRKREKKQGNREVINGTA